jgi:carboxypeptidase Taq
MKHAPRSKYLYQRYREHMQKIADVKNALAVLQWDQETYLPKKGAAFRARQMSTLSSLVHQLSTTKKMGTLLAELSTQDSLSEEEKKNVALSQEDYDKQKKYPSSFVKELSETISQSFHAWIEARRHNSFALFEPELDRLIALKRRQADHLGYAAHPYDALLDEFEKGCTVSQLDKTFESVKGPLKDLLDQVMGQKQVDDRFLHQRFSKQDQWNYGIRLIGQLGFDFEAGRQDLSEHPFTTSFGVHDVRITTRINEHNLAAMTWSCIHEAGHALYEQGLLESQYGLPLGEYTSISIHESQSRLWENQVGRSLGFWTYHFPELQSVFSQQLGGLSVYQFYQGINKVEPTFIRTESDELTYHFHIMIRYELEKLLIGGQLSAHDIPAYWNEQYSKYLNLDPPDDRTGCLQDVHWSHGSFGYFATYSLGSFYAAQLYGAAQKQIPDLSGQIQGGDTHSLLQWLKQRIFRFGRMLNSEEICLQASGEVLDVGYFMQYLLDKYKNIYEF